MSDDKPKGVWIDPNSKALAHLVVKEKAAQPRNTTSPAPPAKPTPPPLSEAERLRNVRAEEKHSLTHEAEVERLRVEVERARVEMAALQKKKRAYEDDEPDAPQLDPVAAAAEEARQAKLRERLREREAEAKYGREVVAQSKAEAISIFRDVYRSDAEKYTLIRQTLDAYNLNPGILPPAIQELIARMDAEERAAQDFFNNKESA